MTPRPAVSVDHLAAFAVAALAGAAGLWILRRRAVAIPTSIVILTAGIGLAGLGVVAFARPIVRMTLAPPEARAFPLPAIMRAAWFCLGLGTGVVATWALGSGKTRRTDRVFVCYRRADSADAVGRVVDRLAARFGVDRVVRDVHSVGGGGNVRELIRRYLAESSALIAVIGPRWLDAAGEDGSRRLDDPSDFVTLEIETALAFGLHVIPVLVGGARLPPRDALPPRIAALADRNAMSVRPDPDFETDVLRLIETIERAGTA